MAREQSIEPQRWARRDKRLEAAQVLQIARFPQRASLEEVAGSILEWTEQNHPDAVEQTATEIDAFFAGLPAPAATLADEFLAELRAALPPRWAYKAETIWRAQASSGTAACTR
jgi:ABC-type transporter Mla subunit MlaD